MLVIDDEEALRRVAVRALSREGFEVLAAADGEEGLALYDAHRARVRLVLVDLTMPKLNGQQTLAALRERDATVPVVLMSGYSESTPQGEHVLFLPKPFRVNELLKVVEEALAPR